MGKYTKLLILLVLVLIIVAGCAIALNIKQFSKQTKKEVEIKKVYVTKKEKLNKADNVILFGDSITEIYPVDEIFSDYRILKSGTSGYTTTDLLKRMDEMLYIYNPTKVFLLIGTNDIMNDISDEKQQETINHIEEIIEKIKKNRPEAKIYVESIYPVNRSMKKEMVAKRENEVIQKINKEIKKYCEKHDVTYINMYDELLDSDGNFNKEYTYDGLHPNTMGYARISRVLYPYIYNN